MGARALATPGERDRALEWLTRALAIDPDDLNVRNNAARPYARLDEFDQAIDMLHSWLPLVGDDPRRGFKNDYDLEPIRNHPRYGELLDLMK